MEMTDGGQSRGPDYNEVTYEEQWNFAFRQCDDTGSVLLPFTTVYKRTYWLTGGMIVGASPVQLSKFISASAYTMRIISDNK